MDYHTPKTRRPTRIVVGLSIIRGLRWIGAAAVYLNNVLSGIVGICISALMDFGARVSDSESFACRRGRSRRSGVNAATSCRVVRNHRRGGGNVFGNFLVIASLITAKNAIKSVRWLTMHELYCV